MRRNFLNNMNEFFPVDNNTKYFIMAEKNEK